MNKLGTEDDYIMTSPLSKFDDYDRYDLMGIKSDLKFLMEESKLSDEEKDKAKKRYLEVIHYIKDRLGI